MAQSNNDAASKKISSQSCTGGFVASSSSAFSAPTGSSVSLFDIENINNAGECDVTIVDVADESRPSSSQGAGSNYACSSLAETNPKKKGRGRPRREDAVPKTYNSREPRQRRRASRSPPAATARDRLPTKQDVTKLARPASAPTANDTDPSWKPHIKKRGRPKKHDDQLVRPRSSSARPRSASAIEPLTSATRAHQSTRDQSLTPKPPPIRPRPSKLQCPTSTSTSTSSQPQPSSSNTQSSNNGLNPSPSPQLTPPPPHNSHLFRPVSVSLTDNSRSTTATTPASAYTPVPIQPRAHVAAPSLQLPLSHHGSDPWPHKRTKQTTLIPCRGLFSGALGPALSFAGYAMLHTGSKLLEWAREGDAGVKSFSQSILAQSRELLLPYCGVMVRRAKEAINGFYFTATECTIMIMNHREVDQSVMDDVIKIIQLHASRGQNLDLEPHTCRQRLS